MTKSEICRLIDAELEWCEKTPLNMPEDFRDGFTEGLKQVKRLIRKYKTHVKS